MARRVDTFLLNFVMDSRKFSRNLRELVREVDAAETRFESVRDAASDVFSGFNLFDVAQVGAGSAFIKKSVDAYGELINVQQTATQVFDDSFQTIRRWAEGAVDAVGLSERAAIESATFIAGLGKQIGLVDDELAAFSTDIVQLGADLAAAFNTDVQDAINAIQSGFAGTSVEPLRKYNIVINDTAIKQEYAAVTGEQVVGVLDQQQRAVGFLSLLYQRSADYIGQWDRESDQLLGTQQRLRAQFENTSATLGETYAPAVLTALDSTLALGGAIAEFDQNVGGLVGAAAGFGAVTLALTPLRRAVTRFNQNLQETSGNAAAVGANITKFVNPAIIGLTGALTAYSVAAAQIAKQQREVTQSFEEFAESIGDDTTDSIREFTEALDDMAEAEAFSDFSGWDIVRAGLSGVTQDWRAATEAIQTFIDAQELTVSEAQEGFRALANDNLDLAGTIRVAADEGGELAQNYLEAGLTVEFMDSVLRDAALRQEEYNDLADRGAAFVDNLAGSVTDVGDATEDAGNEAKKAALDEYYKKVAEEAEDAAERTLKFRDLWSEIGDVRLDAQVDAFDSIFDQASRPREVAENIRDIFTALYDLQELDGDIQDLWGSLFDPADERGDEFLGALSTIAGAIQEELGAALAEGGVDRFREIGRRYREQVSEGLREVGADDADINEVLKTLGIDEEGIEMTVSVLVDASASAEALALLDLMRDEGLLGEGAEAVERFIKLSTLVDDDPQRALDAVQRLALESGVNVPVSILGEFDAQDAADTLDDLDLEWRLPIKFGPPGPGTSAYEALLDAMGITGDVYEVPVRPVPEKEYGAPTFEDIWGPDAGPIEFGIAPTLDKRPEPGRVDSLEDTIAKWPGMPVELPSSVVVEDVGTDEVNRNLDDAAEDRTARIFVEYMPVYPLYDPSYAFGGSSRRFVPSSTANVPQTATQSLVTNIYNPPGTPAATAENSILYRSRNGDRTIP